ncbi:hypothetical protein HYU07_05810 [Candidatus Woesearchaeota archaeon]|nr:hypothetical protein [Candidatus Woesearchaeota archaeon]
MIETRKSVLETKCLEIAKRHLRYVLSDPNLNLYLRSYKTDEIHEFYARLFNNLGMLYAGRQWHEAANEEIIQPQFSERKNEFYLLKDLFLVLRVNDDLAIFKVLEYSGAEIQRQGKKGDFLVDNNNIRKIVDYLMSINAIDIKRRL